MATYSERSLLLSSFLIFLSFGRLKKNEPTKNLRALDTSILKHIVPIGVLWVIIHASITFLIPLLWQPDQKLLTLAVEKPGFLCMGFILIPGAWFCHVALFFALALLSVKKMNSLAAIQNGFRITLNKICPLITSYLLIAFIVLAIFGCQIGVTGLLTFAMTSIGQIFAKTVSVILIILFVFPAVFTLAAFLMIFHYGVMLDVFENRRLLD